MIFFSNDFINNSDKNNALLENEKEFINSNISIQKKTKDVIINYMQNFASSTETIDIDSVNSVYDFLGNLKTSLNLCNENISNLEILVAKIEAIISSVQNKSSDLDNIIEAYNTEYCNLNKKINENTLQIQDCLYNVSQKSEFKFEADNKEDDTNIDVFLEQPLEVNMNIDTSIKTAKESDTNTIHATEITIENNNTNEYKENTLIVSEMSGKVILPYDMSKVKELYENNPNKYSSIDDVIEKKYTLPVEMYKNTFVSRFKEAFKLMRNKERASIAEAFELGFELMFNYNLHPAIISACKNLDELDIYLDYLESGKTSKFDCFKVVFELPPAIVKQKNPF